MAFKHRIAAVFLLLGCGGPPTWPTGLVAGDYGPTTSYLAERLRQQIAEHGVKGVSIALVDDQSLVWFEGFGLADEANKRRATGETIYQIGSITKLLTATAVMQLVEQGRIGLDQPLSEILPELTIRNRFVDAAPITVRSLLAHHSGLPTDVLKGMWDDNPPSLEQFVGQLSSESLVSAPQTMYRYSNVEYSVLGRIIERVEQRDFASAMQARLDAWGMSDASLAPLERLSDRYARGYAGNEERKRLALRDISAGSVLASAADLAHFIQAVFAIDADQSPLMRAATLEQMLTPQFAALPLDFGHRIGLGWMLSGMALPSGVEATWHNGGYPPFQAHVSMLREHKLAVVILSNSDGASAFLNSVAAEALQLMLETKTGTPHPVTQKKATPKEVKLSQDALKRFAGSYAMFNGQLGSIDLEGEHLAASLLGQRFRLAPISEDTFMPVASAVLGLVSVPVDSLRLQFRTVEGREVALLEGLPAPYAFERIPHEALTDAWRARLGRYEVDTTTLFDFQKVELVTLSDTLVLSLTLPGGTANIALLPISDDEAIVAGLGGGEGGTLRVLRSGERDELVYSGFHFPRALGSP